jgi:hypothetical protein
MKGWRTLAFNAGSAIVTILEAQEFIDVIPSEYTAWAAFAAFLINMGLRYVTTTPVGQK